MADLPKPPDAKPTVELPKVPDWAIELTKSVKLGFVTVNDRLDKVVDEGIEANTRLTRIEVRVENAEQRIGDVEGRTGKASLAVRAASQVDLEQAAQLAQERSAREALATKVQKLDDKQDVQLALLQQLVKLTEKPVVKLVFTSIGTAILGYLSARGLK